MNSYTEYVVENTGDDDDKVTTGDSEVTVPDTEYVVENTGDDDDDEANGLPYCQVVGVGPGVTIPPCTLYFFSFILKSMVELLVTSVTALCSQSLTQ